MNHLGLFAKFWQPGRVKTRLGAELGDDLACRTYQFFLSHSINQLNRVGQQRTLVFSPAEQANAFQAAAGTDWHTVPQADGDLGDRMKGFFESTFTSSKCERFPGKPADVGQNDNPTGKTVSKIIVIGSDCPQLTASQIENAFCLLDQQPVVLGPSQDGGYYLIGMKNECVELFDQIDWSTNRVFSQTLDRLQSLGVGHAELEMKVDIDDVDDLLSYHATLIETAKPGDPDFLLCGALDGVLAQYRQRGGKR